MISATTLFLKKVKLWGTSTYLLEDTIQPITSRKESICCVGGPGSKLGSVVVHLTNWPFSLALGFVSELCEEKACKETWEGKFTWEWISVHHRDGPESLGKPRWLRISGQVPKRRQLDRQNNTEICSWPLAVFSWTLISSYVLRNCLRLEKEPPGLLITMH